MTSGNTNQTFNLHGDLFQQILKFSQNGGYLWACLVYRARPISLLHWRLGWMHCERKLSTVAQWDSASWKKQTCTAAKGVPTGRLSLPCVGIGA